MRKIFLVTFFIVVVLIITIVVLVRIEKETEGQYFEDIGIESFFYQDVLESLGSPISVEVIYGDSEEVVGRRLIYKNLKLAFFKRNEQSIEKYMLNNIRISDPNYRIRKKIGVGSSKANVEKELNDLPRIEDVMNGYIDGEVWIEFIFDRDNKVSEILIYKGP